MKELISCIKNLPKHFKESLVNLWRNGAMSFSSIFAVTITLLLIGVISVLALNVQDISANIEDGVRIYVKLERSIDENAEKEVISDNAGDSMLVDGNNSIRVKNAEALYLITVTDRTFDLTDLDETSSASQVMERFKAMESGDIIEKTGSLQAAYFLSMSLKYSNINFKIELETADGTPLGKPMVVFYKD